MTTHLPKKRLFVAIVSALLVWAGSASAAPIVLEFEGLQNLEAVGNFYSGGFGGSGSGPGPNHGIVFGANSLAVIDSDAGGSGNIGGEPSGQTVLFFLTGSAIMNVAAGFDTGFSFFYSAINMPGVVNVWSGLNATGTLLASINLAVTPFNGAPDPTGQFSPFVPLGVVFAGIAMSVDFGGSVDQIAFDDITLGSATPGTPGTAVPEPVTLVLLGTGLAVAIRQRRR